MKKKFKFENAPFVDPAYPYPNSPTNRVISGGCERMSSIVRHVIKLLLHEAKRNITLKEDSNSQYLEKREGLGRAVGSMSEIQDQARAELQLMVEELQYPHSVSEAAFIQFLEYLKKTKNFVSRDKLKSVLRTAVLVVVRSLQLQDAIEENLPCSLRHILGDQPEKLEETVGVMREWTTFGSFLEETRLEMKSIVEEFAYMQTIYIKFDKVFKYFSFLENNQHQKSYNKQVKHLAWLMLLSARDEHAQQEKSALLSHFRVVDVDGYELIAARFVASLKLIFEQEVLQHDGDIFTIFSPERISINIQNLSILNQKCYNGFTDIDAEFFIINPSASTYNTQQAFNLTPFSRQGGYNKHAAPFPMEKYAPSPSQSTTGFLPNRLTSQRLLNFDNSKGQAENINPKSIIDSTISFPITTAVSPYQLKQQSNQQIQQRGTSTPVTNAMEMYNWLHSRKNLMSSSTGTIALELNNKVENLEDWLHGVITRLEEFEQREKGQRLEKTTHRSSFEQRSSQISSLFYRILHEYYAEERSVSPDIQRSIFVCACESVYFILNERAIKFERLAEFLNVSWFDLWKVMDFFLKLDNSMPVQLKAHMLDLEVKIVSYYSWREESILVSFVRTYLVDQEKAKRLLEDRQDGHVIEKYFLRAIQCCAFTIQLLSSQLNLSDSVSEGAWQLMKHIFGNQSEILIGRHIDQLVLCSIYVMCRISQSDTLFRTILDKYEEVNARNKPMMRELIYDMTIDSQKRDTIVEFYNVAFLVNVKKIALSIGKTIGQVHSEKAIIGLSSPKGISSPRTKNPAITTEVFTSPLKEMFSNDVCKSMGKLPTHMTPQTQMLYAYTESPLFSMGGTSQLQHQPQRTGTQRILQSKKMLDFDTESQNQSQQRASTNHTSSVKIHPKVALTRFSRQALDSIAESQQEQQTSSLISNKFRRFTAVPLQDDDEEIQPRMRRRAGHLINTEGDESNTSASSSNQENLNQSNNTQISAKSSQSRVVAFPDLSNNMSEVNSNQLVPSSSARFLRQFSRQQVASPISKAGFPQQQFLTPMQKPQTSAIFQPLSQIPMQKINSWQNQIKIVSTPQQPFASPSLSKLQNQTANINGFFEKRKV